MIAIRKKQMAPRAQRRRWISDDCGRSVDERVPNSSQNNYRRVRSRTNVSSGIASVLYDPLTG